MRDAFEEWAIATAFTNEAGLTKHNNDYVAKNTYIAWKVWQAAWEMPKNDND